MLIILPISYEFTTSLSPKRVARKLDGELVEKRPTLNVMSASKFAKAYKTESVYYGCRTSSENFRIFYHMAGKRDGGSTGFYGTVEKTEGGSKIHGSFRKPISAYVFGAAWTIVTLLFALFAYALENIPAAVCGLVLFALGIFILFRDGGKKNAVKAYLESFPKIKSTEDKED